MGKNHIMRAKEWNSLYPPGTPVELKDDLGKMEKTETRSFAWELDNGEVVVKVQGKPGCYIIHNRIIPFAGEKEKKENTKERARDARLDPREGDILFLKSGNGLRLVVGEVKDNWVRYKIRDKNWDQIESTAVSMPQFQKKAIRETCDYKANGIFKKTGDFYSEKEKCKGGGEKEINRIISTLVTESHKTACKNGFAEKGTKRNVGEVISLIHSELSEALDAIRNGDPISKKIFPFSNFEEELADVLIRVFDLCGERDLELGPALQAKMAYNKTRSFKHGGKEF